MNLKNVQISSGTTQFQRLTEPFKEGYVNFEEMTFEDLIVYASGFAHLIKYFNPENQEDGDWSFIWEDEIVVLAEIMKIDIFAYQSSVKNYSQNALYFKSIDKKVQNIGKIIEEMWLISNILDHWMYCLLGAENSSGEEFKIRVLLEGIYNEYLKSTIQKVYNIQLYFNYHAYLNGSFSYSLDTCKYFKAEEAGTQISSEAPDKIILSEVLVKLENCFNEFYQAFVTLKNSAAACFRETLTQNYHLPQVGLYLSYINLYRHSAENLNRFNSKFVNYYYKEFLQFKPYTQKPDKVYLTAKVQENTPGAKILKDERFVAGEDKTGTTVIYNAVDSSMINKIKIEKVYNFYVAKQFHIVRGINIPYIRNIYTSEIDKEVYTSFKPLKAAPVLGLDQMNLSESERNMGNARLGFAFSSRNFFLRSGKRDIEIDLTFSKDSFQWMIERLNEFAASMRKPRNEIDDLAFQNTFNFTFTTPESWYIVPRHTVRFSESNSTIQFSFTIPDKAPPISAFNPEVHKGNYKTVFPLMQCILQNDSFLHGYCLLEKLVLKRIQVNVNVTDFKDINIYNHFGQLDANSIFQPFGPTPRKGDYFIVGSDEIFNKEINSLVFRLKWFELPDCNEGFKAWYLKYGLGYTNDSFKVRLAILDDRKWKPVLAEQQEFNLFADDIDRRIASESILDGIEISKIWRSYDIENLGHDMVFTTLSPCGFIRFELTEPDFAFAHDVYPSILSKLMSKKNKGGLFSGNKKEDKNLNLPYTPQIQDVSIDYSAESFISFNETFETQIDLSSVESFYHIYPQGEVLVYPDATVRNVFMIPHFDFEGALYIGLSNVEAPQMVSFLFEILESSVETPEINETFIEWDFLANNKWHLIDQSSVYMDQTSGFRQTGIIQIEIPAHITNNNTLLPEELFWLRARGVANTIYAGKLVSAHTGAFVACLDTSIEYTDEILGRILPAHTIERPAVNIEGIAEIYQPLPSFDGYKTEDELIFNLRIAEKLHHKTRAICIEDFEKIVLQRFNKILKVVCFPNTSYRNIEIPGHVLLVVIPYKIHSLDSDEPKVGNRLLIEIRDYLKTIASPFIKIDVRNPDYEHVKVICSVKFRSGYSSGYYIRELNQQICSFILGIEKSEDQRVQMGARLHVSDMLSFLRSLPFVEIVAKLSMIQITKDFKGNYREFDTADDTFDFDFLQGTKPWSVLAPFPNHEISVIADEETGLPEITGIGSLRIGSELVIN